MMVTSSPRGFRSNAYPLNPLLSAPPKSLAFDTFQQKIEQEFVEESGIHPALYEAFVRVVRDIEVTIGGEISTPIHDALDWRYTRFGNQAKLNLYAALLENEDGSTWQAKLSQPRIDDRGEEQKYECPKGGGAKAFLPAIPPEIRQLLQQRYGCEVPPCGESFWGWLEQHLEIPIVLTEGGKKAASALSQGYSAIALFGCNGGYRSKDALGNPVKPYLIPDVEQFAVPGRKIILGFDQDESEKTRRRVGVALARFGGLLAKKGCEVLIASWHSKQGKGLDDLIVNSGADAWHEVYANAIPLIQWQFTQRLEQRLTYPANLNVTLGDLSKLPAGQIEQIPEAGLVGIGSAKGTGKTKLLKLLTQNRPKVLALSHRIALARNLGKRLDLTYRSDADKVQGRFISESGYTQRLISVVDGLLSIDPTHFAGCDLILDEVTQEIRHHLTSSTCATDGKRPVILARFAELVRNAKRIIVADADLDNATLHYLQALRGGHEKPYLIRNSFQQAPYNCRFIGANDRTPITADFLKEASTLPTGKVLFVATDSKATSKSLARILTKKHPEKRVLVLNSDTSGGELERNFTENPDQQIQNYDIIICSPSLATGVSIECRGIVHRVHGIFTGASSNDADISQALSRVREPVDRVVWVAKSGSNYSKVSRSTNPLEVRHHMRSLSTATVQLIRASLRSEVILGIEPFDWQSDPHISLYCHLAAEQNRSMRCLREAVMARLKFEGNALMIQEQATNPAIKLLLAQSQKDNLLFEAETLVKVESLNYLEVQQLEEKQSLGKVLTPEERATISKFYLMDFYCLEELTIQDCLWDNQGRRRGEILNLEDLLLPSIAADRSAKSLEKQANWNQGYCPWDFSHTELRRCLRDKIGLTELVHRAISGWRWCKYDLKTYADRARELAPEIKVAFHFTVSAKISDVQVIHQLLSQLGVVLERGWSRSVPGHEEEKLRVYSLDQDHWQKVWGILQRRDTKRQQIRQQQQAASVRDSGSPARLESYKLAGDPADAVLAAWFTVECLEDVQQMWAAAEGNLEVLAEIKRSIPDPVLRHLRLVT